ncbi:MAG TPA: T9SS type A sorting domain-containing protein [Bacteroidia bacterium]|nr:T9SS type A sorting domain-containing protein [Bacteroidia bacterium]
MRKTIILASLFIAQAMVAQFAPPAGQPGTTAMYKDSSAFVAWATAGKIIRGYQNVSNPSLGYATVGDSSAVIGKADGAKIVSLGDGGSAIITFKQPIKNESGNDFAVFENSFNDTFLELAFVEVSSDGVNYFRFPAVSNTQDTLQMGNDAFIDARHLNNLAGKYRSGYGTPFDLQELEGISGLNINRITHVKIIDAVGSINPSYATTDKNGNKINDPWPTGFASSGFDLDAVGVIHQETTSSIHESDIVSVFEVFPNPITSSSVIQLTLEHPKTVSIDVADLMGRQVALLEEKIYLQQSTSLSLTSMNLKNGIYFLRINLGAISITKKIMVTNE